MLEAALKVVEAARSLRLVHEAGRTRSELSHLELARAIDALRASVDVFDRETGRGSDTKDPAPAARPGFAAPPQLEDEGFVLKERMVARIKGVAPFPEMEPEAVEALEAQAASESRPSEPVPEAAPPVPLPVPPLATGGHDPADGLEEGLFHDGDESAADLMRTMEAIDAKLAYAVSKVGWSPRLRALAAAQRIAFENMFIEVDGPGGWVRIPARNWGTLTVAIAEAALDQDLSLALPRARPKASELEYSPPAPRPGQ